MAARKKHTPLEMLAQVIAAMQLAGPAPAQQKYQTKWNTETPIDPSDQPAIFGPDQPPR